MSDDRSMEDAVSSPNTEITALAQQVATARGKLPLQHDTALYDALSDSEIRAERELAEWIRAQRRKQRRRAVADELAAEQRDRRTGALIRRSDEADARWHRKALAARRRVASPDARLAQLYRRAEWSSRALIGVVVLGMVWAGVNVQHNLVPSGDMSDPLYWLSFGIEAMISIPIITIMVAATTAARWGRELERGKVLVFELALLGTTVALNAGPHLASGSYGRAAEFSIAPVMVGVVIWLHAWVSARYAVLIEGASVELPGSTANYAATERVSSDEPVVSGIGPAPVRGAAVQPALDIESAPAAPGFAAAQAHTDSPSAASAVPAADTVDAPLTPTAAPANAPTPAAEAVLGTARTKNAPVADGPTSECVAEPNASTTSAAGESDALNPSAQETGTEPVAATVENEPTVDEFASELLTDTASRSVMTEPSAPVYDSADMLAARSTVTEPSAPVDNSVDKPAIRSTVTEPSVPVDNSVDEPAARSTVTKPSAPLDNPVDKPAARSAGTESPELTGNSADEPSLTTPRTPERPQSPVITRRLTADKSSAPGTLELIHKAAAEHRRNGDHARVNGSPAVRRIPVTAAAHSPAGDATGTDPVPEATAHAGSVARDRNGDTSAPTDSVVLHKDPQPADEPEQLTLLAQPTLEGATADLPRVLETPARESSSADSAPTSEAASGTETSGVTSGTETDASAAIGTETDAEFASDSETDAAESDLVEPHSIHTATPDAVDLAENDADSDEPEEDLTEDYDFDDDNEVRALARQIAHRNPLRLTLAQIEEILELTDQSWSARSIGAEVGVSGSTVTNIVEFARKIRQPYAFTG
ncbi:hypothetical protein [Nocardia asteroides]|uniref:hypothetical protein n=1 Tax=Nocardia asteroides TaxID=1824 RepID=UPI003650A336